VSYTLSVITIGIDPTIEIGPVTVAWHGLTIAIGIVVGGLLAGRFARSRGLASDPLTTIGAIVAASALVGGRLFYLAEKGELLEPSRWFGSNGFTFNGGFIAAAIAITLYVRARRLDLRYLDCIAVALPLGIAVGRIGDVINGEHYGDPTSFFLGVRNTHPDALVPSQDVAYHSGGLYEVILGLLVFVAMLVARRRLQSPLMAVWLVFGLLAAGRFFEFFLRSDSEELAGLATAQWSSLILIATALVGARFARRRARGNTAPTPAAG
jgi:phosphatidylglycerol---prolipoprotein diacylglyceryl transferase